MIDMFDTIGTLFAACDKGNMLTEKGEVPNMEKAMFADAAATTVGAVCGTSTVTTLCRVCRRRRRGRKNRTFLHVYGNFLCGSHAAPAPLLSSFPPCATAAALIYVGVLMAESVKKIDWKDAETAVPAFLTMVMMPFAYNISYGIAFGLISYHCHKALCGKGQKSASEHGLSPPSFVATLLLTH